MTPSCAALGRSLFLMAPLAQQHSNSSAQRMPATTVATPESAPAAPANTSTVAGMMRHEYGPEKELSKDDVAALDALISSPSMLPQRVQKQGMLPLHLWCAPVLASAPEDGVLWQ